VLATVFAGELTPGSYSFGWTAVLGDGTPAPSGHYQVQVSVVDPLGTVTQTASFDVAPPPP